MIVGGPVNSGVCLILAGLFSVNIILFLFLSKYVVNKDIIYDHAVIKFPICDPLGVTGDTIIIILGRAAFISMLIHIYFQEEYIYSCNNYVLFLFFPKQTSLLYVVH